jgi:hypothetical protein
MGLATPKQHIIFFLQPHKTTLQKKYKELLTTLEAHSKKPLHSNHLHRSAYARKKWGKLFNIT